MTDSIFSPLDHNSRLLLAIYTMYDVEDSESRKVKTVMADLIGRPFLDMKTTTADLESKGLLVAGTYNWRTDTFDYSINDEYLIAAMVCLHKHYAELAEQVRAACGAMTVKPVKAMLWHFVSSGFKDVPITDFDDHEIERHIDCFVPVVSDERFSTLLLLFNNLNFCELLDAFFRDVFCSEALVDISVVRMLVNNYLGRDFDRQNYLCLCDLYAFLAYGDRPSALLASSVYHRVIAALIEAHRGDDSTAYSHFKQALELLNQPYHSYMRRMTYFHQEIVNFYFVLVCKRCDTEMSRRSALGVYRVAEQTLTSTSKALYEILYSSMSAASIRRRLAALSPSVYRMRRMLTMLLCRYIGYGDMEMERPRWLFLRNETHKFLPMDDEDARKAAQAYSGDGLLTSLYRKPEWENVLEELSVGKTEARGKDTSAARIAYFLDNIDSDTVAVRLQSRLKSGRWGAGKSVNIKNFMDGMVPEMNAEDRQIAKALSVTSNRNVTGIPLELVLTGMKAENRLYVGTYAPYKLVDLTEAVPYINMVRTASGFEVHSNVALYSVESGVHIEATEPASITYILLTEEQKLYYGRLLALGHFPLEAEEQLRDFFKTVGGVIDINSDIIDGGSTLPLVEGRSHLTVRMTPGERGNYNVNVFVRPLEEGRMKCKPGKGDEVIVDMTADRQRMRVQRDLQAEVRNMRQLCDTVGVTPQAAGGTLVIDAYDMLPLVEYAQQHPESILCEWKDGARITIRSRDNASSWGGIIKKNANGWFDIEGSVQVDRDKVLTMAQLFDLVNQSQGNYIKLGEGEFLALGDRLRRQLMQLGAIASRVHGRLQMSPFAAALLGADVLNGELKLDEDDELKQIRERIKIAGRYSPDVPEGLKTTLRKYQVDGYRWMARLNKWGAGALLADDMGLGKTVQTIALLLANAGKGPALVVAPASVAPNWKTELQRFAPSLNVSVLNYAEHRQTVINGVGGGDVVITTYGLLLSVKEAIVARHWYTICLDEAHIIKNRGAKTSAVAMRLQGDNRIMLTGTPVQNHLGELWSLFQFVNPGLLGSFEDFSRRFIIPIEQNGDKQRQKLLDRLVKPFMLRRTKDKVAKELPEKEEIYQHVRLREEEMIVYEVLRSKAEELLMAEVGEKVSMNTLAEITRLRQCSCDMRLVREGRNAAGIGSDMPGSKVTALIELLQTILDGFTKDKAGKANGGVLVFSQFTSYLALIKQALDAIAIPYFYMDGGVSIKARQELVAKFQDGECPVFLISLKAGGLGLNLTRANYVIHTDPWWNPAIEAQATDRAHRIGQRQTVTVYHLIAEGTIEEKIQRLHERKRALVQDILDSTDMSHKLTGEELLNMVRRDIE